MYNNVIALIKICIYDEVRSLYNDKSVRRVYEEYVEM